MEKEITKGGRLLNENGELAQRGYATKLLLKYDRRDIRAKSYRIKEWDYYLIYNSDVGVALTIADNSYMALMSVSFLNFKEHKYKTTSVIKPFTFGKIKLPSSSEEGDVGFKDNRIDISFFNDGTSRKLYCTMKNFDHGKDFKCEFRLNDQSKDSMVIATPFKEDSKAFYYNQKINCMKAEGFCEYGNKKYLFNKDTSTGTLDWGRGVWTYKNTWYWSSASGYVDGVPFGFNLGYGFGDTSAASENMIFYNGKANKLHRVKFEIPKSGVEYEYMKPWIFKSDDRRLELIFTPIMDRVDNSNIGLIASFQHQVFGRFTGKITLDNGDNIVLKDFLGFAERVTNKW